VSRCFAFLLAAASLLAADTAALLRAANQAFLQGRFEEALDGYQAALEQKPGDVRIQYNVGVCAERLGRIEEAIRAYRSVLAADPANSASRQALKRLTEPGDASEVLSQANRLYLHGRYAEALALYETYSRTAPAVAEVLYNMGRCYEKLDRRPQALERYRQALAARPGLAEARQRLEALEAESNGPAGLPDAAPGRPRRAGTEDGADAPPQTSPGPRERNGGIGASTPGPVALERPEALTAAPAAPLPGVEPAALMQPEGPSASAPARTERSGSTIAGLALLVSAAVGGLGYLGAVLALRRRGSSFGGSLDQMSLVDLLQMLAMSRKSGLLSVWGRSTKGHLHLESGRIVAARFGRQTGEAAIYQILESQTRTFQFKVASGTRVKRREFDLTVERALLQWTSQRDEAKRGTANREASPSGGKVIQFPESSKRAH
jgi:hypothetical protein